MPTSGGSRNLDSGADALTNSLSFLFFSYSLFPTFPKSPVSGSGYGQSRQMEFSYIHRVSKNGAFFFLSELRQMSTNFNKFW